jgi:hypothetical protein
MKRSVVIERLGCEASAGWTTYGTSLTAFSLFLGVATRHEDPSEPPCARIASSDPGSLLDP